MGVQKYMKQMTITELINEKYKSYWVYSNSNGKNSIDPREQLPEVVRKIIYGAYKLNIREGQNRKTLELAGEALKYHDHGDSSMNDSIKGVATFYKSQPATRLLEGIGNFGAAAGDEGAASRYTHIGGTPLLSKIYEDIPFLPMNEDLDQPEYISLPLPVSIINGSSAIGTGKSCYIAEREAREVIEWIEKLYKNNFDKNIQPPLPKSVTTGAKTWIDKNNGYVYYEAIIHKGVKIDDLNKKGPYDIITNLPPKVTPDNVIYNLTKKLPNSAVKSIIDGSGKGRPIYIILPKGYLKNEEDYTKYNLRTARKEQIYIWNQKLNTMVEGTITDVAKDWFEDRCNIVKKRLEKLKSEAEYKIIKTDLIKEFAKNKMINWETQKVKDYFEKKYPSFGEEYSNLILSLPTRTFLPDNIEKNEIIKEKAIKERDKINDNILNIGDFIIKEAYDIIDEQENFFSDKR